MIQSNGFLMLELLTLISIVLLRIFSLLSLMFMLIIYFMSKFPVGEIDIVHNRIFVDTFQNSSPNYL